MALAPVYCLEGSANTKLAITREGLRALFHQTETELYRSDIYRQTLANLQKELGDSIEQSQALIKSACREAIRLALRQLVRQYQVPATSERDATPTSAHTLSESSTDSLDLKNSLPPFGSQPGEQPAPQINHHSMTEQAQALQAQFEAEQPSSQKSKSDKANTPLRSHEEILRHIGQELKQARQAKSLSLNQLHSLTWIPIYHLKALEDGQVDQLPEDIYVRGFIRRVGDTLGLDGSDLALLLPQHDPAKSVVPSWYIPNETAAHLRPVHLYLGYAALMAGAVGGLAWMSHQPFSSGAFNPDLSNPQELSSAQRTNEQSVNHRPGMTAKSAGAIAGHDLAPPETMPF